MPPRNKVEDMKAATEMMEKGTTVIDIIKILHEAGFEDVAENLLNQMKQRVIGDYLHTSAIFDENFNVISAVNERNDYMGPGTGYRISDERWSVLKEKFSALKPEEI
jgi:propanediol dehydratase large subunit